MSSPDQTKKLFMETFGCQMNVLDTELVMGSLKAQGYELTAQRENADVILYNTCSVRQQAEDKVYGRLGDAVRIKREKPETILGVIGCMAERDGEDMLRRYPQVDLMCGPGELDKVPMLIDNVVKTRSPEVALQGNTNRRSGTLAAAADQLENLDLSRSISASDHNGSAYVRITRGCNKFCTYCVVPNTRGAEVHRPPDHILEECKRLADAGVIEVTLLGQTVNHYIYDHGARSAGVADGSPQVAQIGPGLSAFTNEAYTAGRKVTTFANLLQRIHDEVPAIKRLRFVTSFPRDFGDDILEVMANNERICRYLHVPAQHGSNRMLKLMNRGYTVEQYYEFIDRVRHFMPDAMIASDFIVGFPTETEEEFEQACEVIRYARFKNSFIFKYSPRPGTIAIDKFADDIPEEVKKRRNNQMLAVQAEVSDQISQEQVGKTVNVMIEGISNYAKKKRFNNVELGWDSGVTQLSGRTDGDLIVMVDGDESLIGQILPVTIHDAKPLTLFGKLATDVKV